MSSTMQDLGNYLGEKFADLEARIGTAEQAIAAIQAATGSGSGSPDEGEGQSMTMTLDENGNIVLSWPTNNSISSVFVNVSRKSSSTASLGASAAAYPMSNLTYVNGITSVTCSYQGDCSSYYYIAVMAVFVNSAGEVVSADMSTMYPAGGNL